MQEIEKNTNKIVKNGFSKTYSFATENVGVYYNKLNVKNKTILTVGSSIDQAFVGTMLGAKEITILDINPNSKQYFELKKAAILALSREDLFHFLYEDPLNIKDYQKVEKILRENSKKEHEIWSKILEEAPYQEVAETFFTKDRPTENVVKRINPYLQDDLKYQILKRNLENMKINLIEGDIFNSSVLPDEKYDRITLSNVLQYLNRYTKKEEQREKLIDCFFAMKDHLNEDGILQLLYLYDFSIKDVYQENHPIPTYNLKYIWETIKEHPLELNFLEGYHNEDKTDAIVTYTKKRG